MDALRPSAEPRPRRRLVDSDRRRCAGALLPVLSSVQEHVRQRVPHLARRAQRADVVATEERRPGALEDSIHSSRDARADGLHRAAKCLFVFRFEQQVQVIALDEK
jgi:hypothetical protein